MTAFKGFSITTPGDIKIRFSFYHDGAPATCKAFKSMLPFSQLFFHARLSGLEIWADNAQQLNIPQENASVFAEPGEIVLGPINPVRVKTSKCIGIYYGEGKGIDAANIFGKVYEEDMNLLKELGDSIWKTGAKKLQFEVL